MSKKIAIIGAGCAGLHLALYLQKHGVTATIFTDRKSEEYKSCRLLNTVAHHHVTISREDMLGCNHWPADKYGYFGHYYSVYGQEILDFYGSYTAPSRAVDYRIYLPQLQDDFIERGGDVRFQRVEPEDVAEIEAEFDLVIVCTGKGPFGRIFGHQPEHSPFDRPQRMLCVGLFKGIEERPIRAVNMHFSPNVGEMIEIPTLTYSGMSTALVIENHIGGDMEILAKTKYEEDPEAFLSLLTDRLKKYYPKCAERINSSEFDLANNERDLLQGGVTPTVRDSYKVLESGKLAVALGDVHGVVDPVLGQGANMASYAAIILGEEILRHDALDARFMEAVDARRMDRVLCASRWTNFMLKNLEEASPSLMQFVEAISASKVCADDFTENFNFPERQWDCFASPNRTSAWIASRMEKHTGVREKVVA